MPNNRQLARNLLFNCGTFFINLCLIFFLSPFLVRTVGKEAYGFYPLIGNIIGYSSIISSAIGSMAGRFITMSYYRENHEEAQSYFNSVLFANLILSLFFAVLVFVGTAFLPCIIQIPDSLVSDVRCMFLLSGFAMIIGLCFSIFAQGAYVKNRIDVSSSCTLSAQVMYALVIIALFAAFKPTVAYIAVASLVAALFTAFLNVKIKQRLLPEIQTRPFRDHSFTKIKRLVSSGIWNSVNQLSNVLLNQVDLLICNIMINVSATGDYALVKVIPNFIYTFLAMLSSTFTPNFNILYAKGRLEELTQEIHKSIKIVGFVICVPLGFLLVYAEDFFRLWVPSTDASYLAGLSFITILPMIFGASINPVFGIFTVTNKLKVPSLVLLTAGVLNTAAVFILLKTTSLGLLTIPVVGACQHALRNFIFSPIYAANCLKLKWHTFYPNILRCCVGLAIATLTGWVIKQGINGGTWFTLVMEGLLVAGISYLINMFVLLNSSDRSYLTNTLRHKLSLCR